MLPLFRNYNSLYTTQGGRTCGGDEEGTNIPFFKDAADLRKWIMCVEQNRKLSDLADVSYNVPPEHEDILIYNGSIQQWEILSDDLVFSGGVF